MPTRTRPLRRFVSRFFNGLTTPIAPWLASFGVVVHIGRRSGKTYRTPIDRFRRGERYYFALTEPEVFDDRGLAFLPQPARAIERLNVVTEGLRMRIAPARSGPHPD